MDNAIKAPGDMIRLIQRSVQVSNEQGYTNIRSTADRQDQQYDDRARSTRQQKYRR